MPLMKLDCRQNLVANAEAMEPAVSLAHDARLGESLFEKLCKFFVHGASNEKREGTIPGGGRYTPRGIENRPWPGYFCCITTIRLRRPAPFRHCQAQETL